MDTLRNATMAALPKLLARGGHAIVNIGALGALSGKAAISAYCCAKSSVMKLTESLSEELRHQSFKAGGCPCAGQGTGVSAGWDRPRP